MSQPLRATSFAGIRMFRRAVSGGLIGVCAVVALWSISRGWGGRSKAAESIAAQPNALPPPLLNQKGRLTSIGNGSRRTAFEYDEFGRTTRTVHNFEGQSKPFTTTYGLPQSQVSPTGLGTVPSSQTFPDNERVDYTYDAGGAQQSIKTTPPNGQQQTIISSIFRNSRGQTIAATYGNGAISIYKYNEATDLRLNQIKTAVGAALTITGGVPQLTGGTTLQDYGYSFDSNGDVIGVADNFNPSLSATYGYDTLDQLIRMTPSGQPDLAYTYDRIGNLTGKEGVTQSYYSGGGLGQGPHALASANGVTYSYDNNGNLISTSNGMNITWNSENMPATVVQGGVTMHQKFFVGESLWKKVEPNVTTYYLPSMRIENNQVRKFFGGFAERSPDGSLKFYHGDHLGSASLVTDSAGAMIRRQSYMPYGSDRLIDPNGSFNPKYQFNFKEKESTGFYDYGARLYNPVTGRWLTADSITADGLNRYAYVSNNPVRYVDPTGHQTGVSVVDNMPRASWAYSWKENRYHYFWSGVPQNDWIEVQNGWQYYAYNSNRIALGNYGRWANLGPPISSFSYAASGWAGFLSMLTSPHDLFSRAVGVETDNMRLLSAAAADNPKSAAIGTATGFVLGLKVATPRFTPVGYDFAVIGHQAETEAWRAVPFARVLKVPDTAYSWGMNTRFLDSYESFMRVTAPSQTRYPSVFVRELEYMGETPPSISVVPKVGTSVR